MKEQLFLSSTETYTLWNLSKSLVDGLSLELATMVTVPTLEYSGSLYHQVSNWLYTESFIVLKLQLLI